MLKSFFCSEKRITLITLFIKNTSRKFYLSELCRLLHESGTPLRRELVNLKNVGFLKKAQIGQRAYYSVDENFLLFKELKGMVEKTEVVYSTIAPQTNCAEEEKENEPLAHDEHAA